MTNTIEENKGTAVLPDEAATNIKSDDHVLKKENDIKTNDSLTASVNITQTDEKESDTTDNSPPLSDDSPPPRGGAMNEDGTINWDCPCFGGMSQGPCGEEFKTTTTCFFTSKSEPAGMECMDAFETMRQCFLKHLDVYGDLMNDDLDEEEEEELTSNKNDDDNDIEEKISSIETSKKNDGNNDIEGKMSSIEIKDDNENEKITVEEVKRNS